MGIPRVLHLPFRVFIWTTALALVLTGVYARGKPPKDPPPPPYDPAIAYSTGHCGGGNLYAMNADGSNKTLLVQGGGHPAWFPGGWLLFNHAGTTLAGEGMYVVDAINPQGPLPKIADSSGCVEYVVVNPADPDMIAWSEGGEVTFGIQGPGGWDTVVIDTHPDLLFPGSWSPDGTRITAWVFDTVWNEFADDWIYLVTYDDNGFPAALTPFLNVTGDLVAQGWDMEITDWSSQSDRWLLAFGSQGSQWPYFRALFLVDLSADPPVFYIIAEDSKVDFRNAKWSPCDDRVLVEEVSNSGGGSHKLTVYDLDFDEDSGNFLGVTGSTKLPSAKKEQFFWPDWRPALPGECSAQ